MLSLSCFPYLHQNVSLITKQLRVIETSTLPLHKNPYFLLLILDYVKRHIFSIFNMNNIFFLLLESLGLIDNILHFHAARACPDICRDSGHIQI